MKYIHIKKIEDYNPGYKDRSLIWCKAYFKMLNADPEFELMCEIDKWRFIAFIMLELQTKKPVPLDKTYLTRKGFNLKKRPISLTVNMLHNFIETVTKPLHRSRVEVDVEVEKEVEKMYMKSVTDFLSYFNLKTEKKYTLTDERKRIIKSRLKEGYTLDQLKQAVDNFIQDDWEGRPNFIDIVYCIGTRNKINNLDRWLNWKDTKPKPFSAEDLK